MVSIANTNIRSQVRLPHLRNRQFLIASVYESGRWDNSRSIGSDPADDVVTKFMKFKFIWWDVIRLGGVRSKRVVSDLKGAMQREAALSEELKGEHSRAVIAFRDVVMFVWEISNFKWLIVWHKSDLRWGIQGIETPCNTQRVEETG